MNGAVIAALISGVVTIIVNVITVVSTNNRTRMEISTQLALQDERQKTMAAKVEELSSDVKAHNKFGEKIPVIEEKLHHMENRIDQLERRDAV